jgi:hypothetical protein
MAYAGRPLGGAKPLEPVRVARVEGGRRVLLTGHRRVAALRLLARQDGGGACRRSHTAPPPRRRRSPEDGTSTGLPQIVQALRLLQEGGDVRPE